MKSNLLCPSPKDFLGSTEGDDFDEDSGSSMGALSGRGTPATASSPTTAAFNAVFSHDQRNAAAAATATPSMDFSNLFSNFDVPESSLASNNALGDIMDAVDIPQVGDLAAVPMEDTDEEVVVDDDVEFAGPSVEIEVQFSLQRPLYEMRYLVEAKLGKRVSKKSFFLWNERVDEDSKLSDVCYNSCQNVMVGC